MTQNLSFDQLPNAVLNQSKELGEIKSLLQELLEKKSPKQTEEFLTIQEAAKFLNLSVPTIYSKVSRGELPASKPGGKRLYFSSAELREYLKGGRKKTNADIQAEVDAYLTSKK